MRLQRFLLLLSGVLGLVSGGIAAYFTLSPPLSFLLWSLVGLGIGFLANNNKEIVRSGTQYGLLLTLSFLFLRFGEMSDKAFSYFLLVVFLCLIGIIFGIIIILSGNRIKKIITL